MLSERGAHLSKAALANQGTQRQLLGVNLGRLRCGVDAQVALHCWPLTHKRRCSALFKGSCTTEVLMLMLTLMLMPMLMLTLISVTWHGAVKHPSIVLLPPESAQAGTEIAGGAWS